MILGTGGASKAVVFALQKMGIKTQYVSRKKTANSIGYDDVTSLILNTHKLIVNCTPIGTFPNLNKCPAIPYEDISSTHLLYDLIYNPEKTAFLKMGLKAGAIVKNGSSMLKHQADRAWEIWNS